MVGKHKSEHILTAERAYQTGAISAYTLEKAYELEAKIKRMNRDVWVFGAAFAVSLIAVGVSVATLILSLP